MAPLAPAQAQPLQPIPENFIFSQLSDTVLWNLLDYLDRPAIEMLRFTCRKWKDITEGKDRLKERFCGAAAYYGYRNLIEWARVRRAPWEKPFTLVAANEDLYNVPEKAILGGRIEIFTWARNHDAPVVGTRCILAAIEGGHYLEDCWDSLDRGWAQDTLFCTHAAKHGRLKELKWLRAKKLKWDEQVCLIAAQQGKLTILEWAIANEAPVDSRVSHAAAQGGQLSVLRWLYQHHHELWADDVVEGAAESENMEMWQWLITLPECSLTPECLILAAKHGKLKLAQFLRKKGVQWDVKVCSEALFYNQVAVLEWALRNGAPYEEDLTLYSVGRLAFEALTAALNHRVPLYKTLSLQSFELCLRTVNWAYENKREWITPEVYNSAANERDTLVLTRLLELNIPLSINFHEYIHDPKVLEWALNHHISLPDSLPQTWARLGYIDLITCWVERGLPIDQNEVTTSASQTNREEIRQLFNLSKKRRR